MTQAPTLAKSDSFVVQGGRPSSDREEIWTAIGTYCRSKKLPKDDLGESDFAKISEGLPSAPSSRTIRRSWETMPEEYERGLPEEVHEKFQDYKIVAQWFETRKAEVEAGELTPQHFRGQAQLLERLWQTLDRHSPQNWKNPEVFRAILQLPEGVRHNAASSINQLDIVGFTKFKPYRQFYNGVDVQYTAEWRKAILDLLESKDFENVRLFLADSDPQRKLFLTAHLLTGAREGYRSEGGILNFDWKNVSWERREIDFYESKTEDVWHAPLDLFKQDPQGRRVFSDSLYDLLREKWERDRRPSEGKIFHYTEEDVFNLYIAASGRVGARFLPSWADKLHLSLLWFFGVELEHAASGQLGRGWTNLNNPRKFYLAMGGHKIREWKQKLGLTVPEASENA